MTKPTSSRRWFRFSLRTLLVVVTLVCSYLGWAKYWILQRHEVLKANRVDISFLDVKLRFSDHGELIDPITGATGPMLHLHEFGEGPFPLGWFGEPGIGSIVFCNTSRAEMKCIAKLFPEARIFLPRESNGYIVLHEIKLD